MMMTGLATEVEAIAAELADAFRTGGLVDAPSLRLGACDLPRAYEVQRQVINQLAPTHGAVVGYKVGLTNPAAWSHLGVSGPFFAPLLENWRLPPGRGIARPNIQPAVELELVLRCAQNAPTADAVLTKPDQVFDAMAVGLEIIDSRVAGWASTAFDSIADAGAAHAFAVGPWRPFAVRSDESFVARLGRGETTLAVGTSQDCMGSPLNAVAALIEHLASQEVRLAAGDLVFTGALCSCAGGDLEGLRGWVSMLPEFAYEQPRYNNHKN